MNRLVQMHKIPPPSPSAPPVYLAALSRTVTRFKVTVARPPVEGEVKIAPPEKLPAAGDRFSFRIRSLMTSVRVPLPVPPLPVLMVIARWLSPPSIVLLLPLIVILLVMLGRSALSVISLLAGMTMVSAPLLPPLTASVPSSQVTPVGLLAPLASLMACAKVQPLSTLIVAAETCAMGSSNKMSGIKMNLSRRAGRKSSKEELLRDITGGGGGK